MNDNPFEKKQPVEGLSAEIIEKINGYILIRNRTDDPVHFYIDRSLARKSTMEYIKSLLKEQGFQFEFEYRGYERDHSQEKWYCKLD